MRAQKEQNNDYGITEGTTSKVPAGENGEKSRGSVPALNAGQTCFPLGFSGAWPL